ncbi:hemin transporter [Snodgrassella alvi]|uniref:ShlB/FhaC/HecB family hemolysin secretion/activation protein n=1 Tax=Snodgrassella alvi TaxID=1196083 RepID=UPI000C1E2828|nr:ShlB/FhaC/HecB family hemolysin secretion/activation protein [Snodgrassella alvi]PIT57134.1 hemin transporter [Snodgrassella alvi]
MHIKKLALLVNLLGSSLLHAYAAPTSEVTEQLERKQQQQIIREQQRQQQFQQQMQPDVKVRLQPEEENPAQVSKLITNENPCFAIDSISLIGEEAGRFQFALKKAIRQSHFTPGMCLGAKGVNQLMTLAQNAVIERGYTTTRILASPQDLSSGKLQLSVIPGRIHAIRYNLDNAATTHIGRIRHIRNEFPARAGDILNLRKLEQGLENLRRVPTAEADIQIEPAEEPNQSDIVISWAQRTVPLRLSLSVDDSGSHSTGRYQGGATLSVDNPLGLSDLFYVNYNHDLGGKDSYFSDDGKTGSGTHGYALHYSIPVGNWLIAYNRNHYRYHQAVAGYNENYDYSGNSDNTDIGIPHMLYRNSHRKTDITAKLWRRESHNFINDAEIEVQQRRTAGWTVNLNHQEYIGNATLNLGIGYKRGTGASNSLRAPEEEFGEGTSRMKIITADVGFMLPFIWGKQHLSYDSNFHGQWNKTPLITQDQISIGGRYTVRGFNGEMSLMGERGWYWNNNLNWQYKAGQQVYLGLDVGHVAGPATEMQLGKTLAGAVIGFKGQIKAGGQWYYDIFAGKPIYKPQYFRTPGTSVGFSLNYSI